MEYLYNKEGKKYAVVNKIIGSTQLIVREVFIEKGTENEVLSNDLLTLSESSLFNVPVESYQEKRIKELEVRRKDYEAEFNEQSEKFRRLIKKQNDCNKDFVKIRERILSFCKSENDPFLKLIDYVTGNFEYVVIASYELEIFSKSDFFEYMTRSDGMKTLIPNYASNDHENRKLLISSYSDGSSSSQNEVFLFNDYDEARAKLIELITKKINSAHGPSLDTLKKAVELVIKIPDDIIEKSILSREQSFENAKENCAKSLAELSKTIESYKFIQEQNNKLQKPKQ